MKSRVPLTFLALALLALLVLVAGCKKDSTTNPVPTVPVYNVTATVHNPQGQPQGGATLLLVNPPPQPGKFSALTDSTGQATITAPAGAQTIMAKMGSVFQASVNINVSATAPNVIAAPLQLQQNTALKVLVVDVGGSPERLEEVLHVIGYGTFDSLSLSAVRDSASTDSTRLLNFLKQYTLVFSDCNGGDEYGFPVLARTYGRYVAGGGKIYGGHYNYYNLQYIWPPYFTVADTQRAYLSNYSTDSLQVVDAALAGTVGTLLSWASSIDSRYLSGYERWKNLPPGSKTYAVIYHTTCGVIVENYIGTGKYLWTDYHNQDISSDPNLVKIVQFFLLNM